MGEIRWRGILPVWVVSGLSESKDYVCRHFTLGDGLRLWKNKIYIYGHFMFVVFSIFALQ